MSEPTTDPAPRASRGLAATTWGPGRLDLFWVDEDRALWHSASIDGVWAEPESLGGQLASSPTAVAWAAGEMEVFAVIDDGELWNRYWDHTYWHQWETLGGELDGESTPGRVVIWAGSPRRLRAGARRPHLASMWDGTQWVPWEQG